MWVGVAMTLVLGGCATSPVDISRVKSTQDIDRYVGRKVTVTGIYSEGKTCFVSIGKIDIEAFPPAARPGETVTVTGTLKKCRVLSQKGPYYKQTASVPYFLTE